MRGGENIIGGYKVSLDILDNLITIKLKTTLPYSNSFLLINVEIFPEKTYRWLRRR